MKKKRAIYIIDILSYRGGDDELKRAGVIDIVKKAKKPIQTKQQELTFGIAMTLLTFCNDVKLILYLRSDSKSLKDTEKLVDQHFSEYQKNENSLGLDKNRNQLNLLIGSQSLFCYLGNEISQVK